MDSSGRGIDNCGINTVYKVIRGTRSHYDQCISQEAAYEGVVRETQDSSPHVLLVSLGRIPCRTWALLDIDRTCSSSVKNSSMVTPNTLRLSLRGKGNPSAARFARDGSGGCSSGSNSRSLRQCSALF